MHNSVGIVIYRQLVSASFTSLCLFAPQLASTHWPGTPEWGCITAALPLCHLKGGHRCPYIPVS